MIYISTHDYTIEQLKDLEKGLYYASRLIDESPECEEHELCTRNCRAYGICTDLTNAMLRLNEDILEREQCELHGNQKESE